MCSEDQGQIMVALASRNLIKIDLNHARKHFVKAELTRKQSKVLVVEFEPLPHFMRELLLGNAFIWVVSFLGCLHIWGSTREFGNQNQTKGHRLPSQARTTPKESIALLQDVWSQPVPQQARIRFPFSRIQSKKPN